jgi:hypothetical protein
MYHVMSRGNRRQHIHLNDADRQDFLKTLAEIRADLCSELAKIE